MQFNQDLLKAMFSEGHNNGIVEGIPIDRTRRNIVNILPYFKAFFEKGEYRRYSAWYGLSVCLRRYHYYVRENSDLYKIQTILNKHRITACTSVLAQTLRHSNLQEFS